MEQSLRLLNNLTPSQFLAEYWQKKPLLIRQAYPSFKGFLTPDELAGLACEEEVQSRIVIKHNERWAVKHSPFDEKTFSTLPNKDWSLLVQSVNHHLPEAAKLLSDFNFIPNARLDDLMVSYAPTGGSVGPHTDAYDVFLLQGSGKRRWKLNTQPNLSLIDDAPLAILAQFETEFEWVLEPGDMLYLPPNIAHFGVAEDDECMTYSIGFRSPKKQELTHAFLEFLQDNLQVEGLYQDPDLPFQEHPAEITQHMIDKVDIMLQSIRWDKVVVSDFLARYISEPKADIVFIPPKKISFKLFMNKLSKTSLELDLKSQFMFYQNHFYMNGESLTVSPIIVKYMKVFADTRCLDTSKLNKQQLEAIAHSLHSAWNAGYVHIKDN
jgi:50S ribosomal protein L16 3-hydroxylase